MSAAADKVDVLENKAQCPQCTGRGHTIPSALHPAEQCDRCEGWGYVKASDLRGLELPGEIFSRISDDKIMRSKIDRVCPRCRAHRYHFVQIQGRKATASCAECSHKWACRIMERDGIDRVAAAAELIEAGRELLKAEAEYHRLVNEALPAALAWNRLMRARSRHAAAVAQFGDA